MTKRVRLLGSITASILLVVVVAVATLFVLDVVGGSAQQSPKDALRGDSVLLVADRSTLAICVEPVQVEAKFADEAKARIEELMPSIEKHQFWDLAGLEGLTPVVDIGCPGPPQLLQPTPASLGEVRDPFVNTRRVNNASPYKIHVYIVPETVLDAIPGIHLQRRAVEESICFRGNNECVEVTTGLYLTAKDLGDSAFMYAQLVRVIGLE